MTKEELAAEESRLLHRVEHLNTQINDMENLDSGMDWMERMVLLLIPKTLPAVVILKVVFFIRGEATDLYIESIKSRKDYAKELIDQLRQIQRATDFRSLVEERERLKLERERLRRKKDNKKKSKKSRRRRNRSPHSYDGVRPSSKPKPRAKPRDGSGRERDHFHDRVITQPLA